MLQFNFFLIQTFERRANCWGILDHMTIMATPDRLTKWIRAVFFVSVAIGFVTLVVKALIR